MLGSRTLAGALSRCHAQYLRTLSVASPCQGAFSPAFLNPPASCVSSSGRSALEATASADAASEVSHSTHGPLVKNGLNWGLAAAGATLPGIPNLRIPGLQEECTTSPSSDHSFSDNVPTTEGASWLVNANQHGAAVATTSISSLLQYSHPARRRSVNSAGFGLGAARCFSGAAEKNGGGDKKPAETIQVTFVTKEGEEKVIRVPVGTSMLEAAHQNDIELEGACEGSLACSTCHVIVVDENDYKKLPEPSDEENDMLDLAFGLTETSRLGCQIVAKLEVDGLRLATPGGTADARKT